MTERLVHGQCRRCGTYAERPTYHCETCGTNDVDLFRTPVARAGLTTDEPERNDAIGPVTAPISLMEGRETRSSLGSMTPMALVLAVSAAATCLIAATWFGGASTPDVLKIGALTGGPSVLFALGSVALRTGDEEAASSAGTVGGVAALVIALLLVIKASFVLLSDQAHGERETDLLFVSALLFVVAALAGGIGAITHS